MQDKTPDAEYLNAIENAAEEPAIRNILKNATKDGRLSVTERDTVLGYGRSKIRKIGPAMQAAAEHYGKDGLKVAEKGSEAPVSTLTRAPPPAPLKLHTGPVVEAELADGEPTHLIVREPALPVIDPATLGVALKMWQQLAMVIENNTPECVTMIQGKPWRNAEFWRTARLAYGADKPFLEHEFADYTNGRASCTVRLHMGRRQATATAVAERSEKGKGDAPMNTLVGLAYTRALNRASREVIGLGTKSAEEVEE